MSRSLLLLGLVALLPLLVAARAAPKVDLSVIDSSNIDAAFAEGDTTMQTKWNMFKKQFHRVYENEQIEAHRFDIFKLNLAKSEELMQKNPTAKFGITKFSDMHPVEFKTKMLNFVPAVGDSAVLRKQAMTLPANPTADLPTNFDWRYPDQGRPVAVTAVKDQGQCGSCWAFSATEAVESAWILSGKQPATLAPQQTVDCDTVDQGCNGGDTVTAYQYMQKSGVEGESSYPYFSGNSGNAGSCRYNSKDVIARISGFTYATPNCDDSCDHQNEAQLQQNLYAHGPVSICVDASVWQNYVGGVLTSDSGCSHDYNDLDHCVQLTGFGYDKSTNQKFWSVRNSWNTDWGESGYIRLLFGANTCGVADEATQPTAAK